MATMTQPVKAHYAGNILDNNMLLRVSYKVLGDSKTVSSKVLKLIQNEAVAAKLLKIQKKLFNSPELELIKKADGEMRNKLYSLCLPYDLGVMILPLGLLEHVNDLLTAYADSRTELVNEFVSQYPTRIIEAQVSLEGLAAELSIPVAMLYNPLDYPPVESVSTKFGFEWSYLSFTTPEKLKLAGLYEAEQEKVALKLANVADDITLLMRQTLSELVNHLKDSLEPNSEGKPKRLFATSITNIQDFLQTFEARNITNDAELAQLAKDVSKMIHPNFSIDTLKSDESLKASVHSTMQAIGASLEKLVEEIPSRKFKKAID